MSNAETIATLYNLAIQARNEEMFALINDILDPHVTLDEATSLPFGGHYEGKPAVLQALGNVMKYVDSQSLTPEAILSDGDKVVALFHAVQWRADGFEALGLPAPEPTAFHEEWNFHNGKVINLRPWYFDQATVRLPATPASGDSQ